MVSDDVTRQDSFYFPHARIEPLPVPGQDLDDPPQAARLLLQVNNYLWAVAFPVNPDRSVDPANLGRMLRALADAVDPPRVYCDDAVGRYMRDHHVPFPDAVEALAREHGLMRDTGRVVPFVPPVPPVPPEEPPEGGSAA